jgi:hypothetical protein
MGIAYGMELGIKCPHCDHYRRAYWDAPIMEGFRRDIAEAAKWTATDVGRTKYQEAQARYNLEYEKLQNEIATRLGLPDLRAEDHLGPAVALKIDKAKREAKA